METVCLCMNIPKEEIVDAIAEVAEAHNHHPDILIHSYKQVKITLFTHDAKAITDKDYTLADAIDTLAS